MSSEPEILRQGDAIVVNLPGVKNQQQAEELVKVTGQVNLRPVLTDEQFGIPCVTSDPEDSQSTDRHHGQHHATRLPPPTPACDDDDAVDDHHCGRRQQRCPDDHRRRWPGSAAEHRQHHHHHARFDHATTTPSDRPPGVPTARRPPSSTGRPPRRSRHRGHASRSWHPIEAGYLKARGGSFCYVGPAGGTGEVFQDDAAARILSGTGWGVTVSLRGGAGGEDVWNALASECFTGSTLCPTHQLAIELDGEVISAPTVQQANFTDSVQITGSFSEAEARNLARVINSGSLPVRLETQAVQTVSPTLGKDSLRAAWIAGLVGVGLVFLFMVLYYRLLGVIVAGGLAVSAALIWTVISLPVEDPGLGTVAGRHRGSHRLGRRHHRLVRGVLRTTERRGARR